MQNRDDAVKLFEDIEKRIDEMSSSLEYVHQISSKSFYSETGEVSFKVSLVPKDYNRTPEEVLFDSDYTKTKLLREVSYLQPFTVNGEDFVVCGLKPTGRKYKILGRKVIDDGKVYKFQESVLF